MATLTINSKLRMNSGYEIPILGYGVCEQVKRICYPVLTMTRSTRRMQAVVTITYVLSLILV
jgi:hypothetical protein